MLEIVNSTGFQAEAAVLADLDCSEIWVVAVKGTYGIKDGQPIISDKQEAVCLVDQYYGVPGQSSLKYENEIVFRKPGTDVVINGHAYAPNNVPTSRLDASLTVNGRSIAVRVYGDRLWRRYGFGLSATHPEPFRKMPLTYERAFGGADLSDPNLRNQGAEYRNPIGVGFAMSAAALVGAQLPNLEDPKNEIKNWKQRPSPMGFGFICKHWEPRRSYIGTCDQNYIDTRLPFYPVDFDLRFFQAAHPALSFIPHLRGGEEICLHHMTQDGFLQFRLPKVTLGFRTYIDGKWIDHRSILGTVIVEPDVPRVILVWQSFVGCHRKKLRVEETRVFEKQDINGDRSERL